MTSPVPSPALIPSGEDDSVSAAPPLARYRALVAAGTIRPDPHQAAVAEHLEQLHHALSGYRPVGQAAPRWLGWIKRDRVVPLPRGLYIHGQVGRGKSMMMDLFFASAPVEKKRRVHFHAFMGEVHDRLHALRKAGKGKLADPLPVLAADIARETWLLCFDEFVVNNIADAMILGRLFQALFDQGVVVVATSNFPPRLLYKDGLHRDRFEPFIALIEQRLDVLTLDGPTDYRRIRRAGLPVYYSPLGAEATAQLDRAFADLTDGAPGETQSLTIKARKLSVPCAARGVARFTFMDLCGKPLGSLDYLALAGVYHTLILDRVPLLGPDNHNEARRFITLIDALYEAKTKLIMAAAAPPDALYPTGTGAFEFQRTVSRLMEMQSEAYQALPTAAPPDATKPETPAP